jgi:hypothetical protein
MGQILVLCPESLRLTAGEEDVSDLDTETLYSF